MIYDNYAYEKRLEKEADNKNFQVLQNPRRVLAIIKTIRK